MNTGPVDQICVTNNQAVENFPALYAAAMRVSVEKDPMFNYRMNTIARIIFNAVPNQSARFLFFKALSLVEIQIITSCRKP